MRTWLLVIGSCLGTSVALLFAVTIFAVANGQPTLVQETDLTRVREWMENLTLVGGVIGMVYALLRVSAQAGQLKGVIETSLKGQAETNRQQAETNDKLERILDRHDERIRENGEAIAELRSGKLDK